MGRIINPNIFNMKIDNSAIIKKIELNNNLINLTSSKFEEILREKSELKFSAHAQKRLQSRNIELSESDIEKLKTGIQKIKEKGGNDSVIIADNRAYVVSVKNNTVVTVMEGKDLKENIFTNIDSMMIV
jgi:flagellar operon protein